jgi:parallel beta-helix repeat protein
MGSGAGVGIRVAGRSNVTVHGGTVRTFETGVMVANSFRVVIKENAFTETREGVFLNGSSDCDVKENRAWLNLLRGIMVRPSSTRISTRNQIVENTLGQSHRHPGLRPARQHLRNTITGSIGRHSTHRRRRLRQCVKENSIRDSAAAIQFGPTANNRFTENRLTFNTCGLWALRTATCFGEQVREQRRRHLSIAASVAAAAYCTIVAGAPNGSAGAVPPESCQIAPLAVIAKLRAPEKNDSGTADA